MRIDAPEGRQPLVVPDTRSIEIRVKVCLRIAVAGDFVPLAALLVESRPPALAVLVIVIDTHVDHGGDPREGVAHETDDRAISEADDGIRFDRIGERSRLILQVEEVLRIDVRRNGLMSLDKLL